MRTPPTRGALRRTRPRALRVPFFAAAVLLVVVVAAGCVSFSGPSVPYLATPEGVGLEIDPQLVQDSRENALRAGVADRVSFRWEDLFRADISDATAVMTYLLPDVNVRLQPKLLRELRPGTPIVS